MRDVAVDGYYYLVVSMDQLTGRDRPVQVPFTLTTELTGKPEAGPNYRAARSAGGSNADQRAGATAPEAGSTASSAGAATAPESSAPDTAAPDAAAPETSAPHTTAPDTSAPQTSGASAAVGSPAETDTAASGSALATNAADTGAAGGQGAEQRDTDNAAAVTPGGDGIPAWLWGVIASVVVLGGGALATVLRGRGRGATRYGAQQAGGPGQFEPRDDQSR